MAGPKSTVKLTDLPRESAGRIRANGTRVYRLGMPQVIWWSWVGLILLGGIDLLVQGHKGFTLRLAMGILVVTGIVFALAMWPRIEADDKGIRLVNPFRRFLIPWAAVRAIYLAESLEVESVRQPPKPNKSVGSWAVTAPRRSRVRANYRGQKWDQVDQGSGRTGGLGLLFGSGYRGRPAGYDQLPDEAKAAVKLTAGEVIARELATLTDLICPERAEAENGADLPAPTETLSATWSWPAIAAIAAPVIALIVAFVVH